MPLSAGDKLGPYEILAPIGAGGMGEVYRARDTRLGRDVAIKISAEQFSERFEREARAIAALNHPNICQLYDVGSNYLVMELIEGETLQGPLPLEKALNYARQIADALEAAHEKGIVHRDLKPANIKIKPDGTVKVLDFGLAVLPSRDGSGAEDPANSPTLTISPTRAGMILGTAAYMAPEQARGEPVDKRADIWAFGVVLYEMLAGRRLYEGKTVSDILAAVLIKEPELDRAPPQVRPLLRRCLAKDPRQRLHDAADVRLLLDEAMEAGPAPATAPSRSRLGLVASIAAAVFAVIAAVVSFIHFREKPPVAEAARFEIGPPPTARFTCCLSISPDGRKIAFTALGGTDARPRLWVRALDTVEARSVYLNLLGTSLPGLFWSADSWFVAFNSEGKLKKVEATGGPPQTICDTPAGYTGGAWSPDGVIVLDGAAGLMRVSAAGGDPSPLTNLDRSRQETAHRGPALLADGRHFLYLRRSNRDQNNGIFVGSLDAKPEQQDTRRLLAANLPAVYAPTPDASIGHVLFLRENTLMARPFDAAKLALAGEAVPVAESVAVFAASATGTLIYRTGAIQNRGADVQLTLFDRQGKVLRTVAEPGLYGQMVFSPDGTRVVASRGTSQSADLWMIDLARDVPARFTSDPAAEDFPIWSPDGSRVVYESNRGGHLDLYQMLSNGGGDEELLLKSDEDKFPQSWSRDGRFLLYVVQGRTGTLAASNALWVLPLDAKAHPSGKPFLFARRGLAARFSPDMRWVAYMSDESERAEIYARPFDPSFATGAPPGGGLFTVSKGGGDKPRWGAEGKQLFYLARDNTVMAVDVPANPAFRPGIPKPLFKPNVLPAGGRASNWDLSSDGKQFLFPVPVISSAAPEPITLELNWTAGLKK